MPISDWSSDVCSSDLLGEDVLGFGAGIVLARLAEAFPPAAIGHRRDGEIVDHRQSDQHARRLELAADALADDPVLQLVLDGDRTSVVEGKSVSVRVDLGGRRIIKKKKNKRNKERIETSKH